MSSIFTEILIVEGSYAGIGYSFMVAYLKIFGFSERTIEHESKNTTESIR